MKTNYEPWNIDFERFNAIKNEVDRLKFLIRFAVLAPSTHNSQPWKFHVEDGVIIVSSDENRRLPIADADQRMLSISLGCALENLVIAAEHYGFEYKIEYASKNDEQQTIKIIFVKKEKNVSSEGDRLFLSIKDRRMNRNPYAGNMPEQGFLEWANKISDSQTQIRLITLPQQKNPIIDILITGRMKLFDDSHFRHELASYKRTNFTSSSTGMPGFTMGFSAPVSLIAPFAIRHFNVLKIIRKKEEALLKDHTPLFIIISSKDNKKFDCVASGRVFERLTLMAQSYNIQTAISAIPTFSQDELRKELKTSFYPQIFMRAGYASNVPHHSPRMSAQEVTF